MTALPCAEFLLAVQTSQVVGHLTIGISYIFKLQSAMTTPTYKSSIKPYKMVLK